MKEDLKEKLYQKGKEAFPGSGIFLENILFLLNWGIGFVLLLPFKYKGVSIASWLYLLLLISAQVMLKKHNCTACYYYGKWCHLGWGKLTSLFFKEDSGNQDIAEKFVISYILQLPVISIVAIAGSFLYGFDLINVTLLLIFITVNLIQALVLRKKGCAVCKARNYCKGSAAQ
jgi:hypothetical protein